MFSYNLFVAAAYVARAESISEAHQDGNENVTSREGFMSSWHDIPASLKILLTNPVLMFITLGDCTEGLAISGFATFLPKFIQNQFAQTVSWAALLTGIPSLIY